MCLSLKCDFVSANLDVSRGSISKLLKTLLFFPFQIYHNIHANWWSSICGKTRQKRWSTLLKRELVGKITGFDDILERAQTWSAGKHLKNTWLIDSSSALHRAQNISRCIPRAFRFFFTTIYLVTNCHRKCFIFGGHCIFQQNVFNASNVGPNIKGGLSLSG